jgi:hypothetical protein
MVELGEGAHNAGVILHEYLKGDMRLSMWIPEELGKCCNCHKLLINVNISILSSFLAGRVVGKMGVVITNLQRETKATIKALPRVGESLWVAVVIIGEWKNITMAYKAVSDRVHGGK